MKIILGVDMRCYGGDQCLSFEDEDTVLICPFCNYVDCCIHADYVSNPMLWCEGCGARSVIGNISIDTFELSVLEKIGDIGDLKNIHPELAHINLNVYDCNGGYVRGDNDYNFYYCDLLFIERVINDELGKYRADVGLDEWFIRSFIDNKYDVNFMQLHNIKKVKKDDEEYDEEYGEVEVDFTLSLSCNSYNAVIPAISYPANFDMSHDGIMINLKCKDKDGQEILAFYAGD
jgi:hypothetical protein